MSPEVLLVTVGIEVGILIGVAYEVVKRFIRDGRLMVLHAINSLRAPTA